MATGTAAPRLVVSLEDVKQRRAAVQAFVQACLVDGEDYGTIPGTKGLHLFRPGAEKLATAFGLAPTFDALETWADWTTGQFGFTIRCRLTDKAQGHVEAEGLGTCHTWEERTRYRWVYHDALPAGVDGTTLRSKEVKSKTTGRLYTLYRVENDDLYTERHNVLQMAEKRALVDAMVTVTRLFGLFDTDGPEAGTPAAPDEARPAAGRGPAPAVEPTTVSGWREALLLIGIPAATIQDWIREAVPSGDVRQATAEELVALRARFRAAWRAQPAPPAVKGARL